MSLKSWYETTILVHSACPPSRQADIKLSFWWLTLHFLPGILRLCNHWKEDSMNKNSTQRLRCTCCGEQGAYKECFSPAQGTLNHSHYLAAMIAGCSWSEVKQCSTAFALAFDPESRFDIMNRIRISFKTCIFKLFLSVVWIIFMPQDRSCSLQINSVSYQ